MAVQIVIDTNVRVAAARSNAGASFELLRLYAAGDTRWQWNISTALLIEYEAVLKREHHRQGRPRAGQKYASLPVHDQTHYICQNGR